ncbi:MAG: hypothetical protein M0Q90_06010 [Bacteroidales bacterium]|nr:hypothetical protein [Bacteroidales bacterium]
MSYNRYGYVFNNPLRYTDPSGYFASGDTTGKQQNNAESIVIRQAKEDQQKERLSYNTDESTDGPGVSQLSVEGGSTNYGDGWISDAYNSAIGRMIIPDFIAIGVGFNGIVGVGGGSSIELRWVTHGPEASWKPMITASQSIGGGFSVDATLNLELANYFGNVNNISRSMMQTSTPTGDFPTIFGAGGVAAGGKIGVTGYVTPNVGGSFIIGRELNLGVGLPAGPVPVNGAAGVSNTWILYDFRK